MTVRGCGYQHWCIDVSDMDYILYKQTYGTVTNVEAQPSGIKGYSSWDDAMADTDGTTIFSPTALDSVYRKINVSNYKALRIGMPYNWGSAQLSTPYANKYFKKIFMLDSSLYAEMSYKVIRANQNVKYTLMKLTDTNLSLIFDQRDSNAVGQGYGTVVGTQCGSISDVGGTITESNLDLTKGRYIWCGKNAYGNASMSVLLESN